MKNKDYRASHHRVDASLHLTASKKAQSEGFSMSTLATFGLQEYVAGASDKQKSKAAQRVIDGFNKNRSAELPENILETITNMYTKKDPSLSTYLKALHDAGWSYASLSKPLGITRQGLHLKLTKAVAVSGSSLPLIIVGPGHTSFPAHSSTQENRFDWSIWVENNLYALAVEQAKEDRSPIFKIMEDILKKYLNGELSLPADLKVSRRTRKISTKGKVSA